MPNAETNLKRALATRVERRKVYGAAEVKHGAVMMALFPRGPRLDNPWDHIRFGILTQIVSKLVRYVNNFENGGHADSAHDLINYAAMLEEHTDDSV
jgi:hypothetical protein